MAEKSLGQIGYEAYAEHQHWINYQGTPIPPWAEVGTDIRQAWIVAADAILDGWEDLHDAPRTRQGEPHAR